MPPSTKARRPPGFVLLAGGGTGGHIYPNVAVAEHLRNTHTDAGHFLVSDRPGDAKVMERLGEPFTQSPMRPLPSLRRPSSIVTFAQSWHRALPQALALMRDLPVRAVVVTGGFVSGPAMIAAARLGLPRALVNLDAVPGVANRQLARVASHVFSTYAHAKLPTAERIGLPLRAVSVSDLDASTARATLGLAPDRPTLFITGATHGAESLIRSMMRLIADPTRRHILASWQVYHQCGTFDVSNLQRAYDEAGIRARVVDYCDHMGIAYAAADLVVSRSGAGSVAEAWANGAPTVFLPNPYHKDQHQARNAEPMVATGGAVLVTDAIDPSRTADHLAPVLASLCSDPKRRSAMRAALLDSRPPDGAQRIAAWIHDRIERLQDGR